MIKTFLGTFCLVAGLASGAMAQNIPTTGISSGSSIINLTGYSETNTDAWGSYESLDVSVKAAVAGSGAIPDITLGSLTVGGLGGFQVTYEDGGYFSESFTRQDFSGQAVTSQTNF